MIGCLRISLLDSRGGTRRSVRSRSWTYRSVLRPHRERDLQLGDDRGPIHDVAIPDGRDPSRCGKNQVSGATVLSGQSLQDHITSVAGAAGDIDYLACPENRRDPVVVALWLSRLHERHVLLDRSPSRNAPLTPLSRESAPVPRWSCRRRACRLRVGTRRTRPRAAPRPAPGCSWRRDSPSCCRWGGNSSEADASRSEATSVTEPKRTNGECSTTPYPSTSIPLRPALPVSWV